MNKVKKIFVYTLLTLILVFLGFIIYYEIQIFGQEQKTSSIKIINEAYYTTSKVSTSYPFDRVKEIERGPQGNLWFLTLTKLFVFDGNSFKSFNVNHTFSLHFTSGKLYAFGKDKTYICSGKNISPIIVSKEKDYIRQIIENEKNKWFLVGGNKIYLQKGDSLFSVKTDGFTEGIAPFDSNRILVWIREGFDNKGIFIWDGKTINKKDLPEELKNNFLKILYTDREGKVWLKEDIKKYRSSPQKFKYYVLSNSNEGFSTYEYRVNIVKMFEDTSGKKWAFIKKDYYHSGIASFDGKRWKEVEIPGFDSLFYENHEQDKSTTFYKIIDIEIDKNGDIWLQIDNGAIYRVSVKKGEFEKIIPTGFLSNSVSVIRFINNKWFIGTKNGLTIFDGKEWKGYPCEYIRDIQKGPNDKIYLLSKSGILECFKGELNKIADLPFGKKIKNELDRKNSLEIEIDKKQNIWVLSSSELYLYQDGFWISFGKKEGLGEKLATFISDDSLLWIGGQRNLYKFIQNRVVESIPLPDSLQGAEIKYLSKNKSGGILLATDAGVLLYKSGKFKNLLDDYVLNGNVIQVESGIYGNIWFSVQNAPLHYLNMENGEIEKMYSKLSRFSYPDCFAIDSKGKVLTGRFVFGGLNFYEINYEDLRTPLIYRKWKKSIFSRSSKVEKKKKKPSTNKSLNSIRPKNSPGRIVSMTEYYNGLYNIRAKPTLYKNYLIVCGGSLFLIVMDLESGKIIWTRKVDGGYGYISPEVSDSNIYVASKNLYIYNLYSGKLMNTITILPQDIELYNDELFVLLKNSLLIYSVKDFKEIREIRKGGDNLIVRKGKVWVLDHYGCTCYSIDGELLWERKGSFESSIGKIEPVYNNDTIYIPSRKHLVVIDAQNGNIIQKYEIDSKISTTPSISENAIIFGTTEMGLFCYDKLGNLKWNKSYDWLDNPKILSDQVVKDGNVYVHCFIDSLYAYDILTGTELWKIKFGKYYMNPLAVYKDLLIAFYGRVYGIKR